MTKIINGVASEFEFPADTGVFTQKILEKENEILRKNAENNDKVVDKVNWENMLLKKENEELKKRLNYLRSGEYYNQLKFERDMLQNVVDHSEVSKEDKEFIDMTHRNTELLEENQKLKKQLEEYKEQVSKGLYNTCLPYTTGYNKAIKDKEIQQKEFIKYLEDEINVLNVVNSTPCGLSFENEITRKVYQEILQKYKEIIGGIYE